jgi:hypothetical protein
MLPLLVPKADHDDAGVEVAQAFDFMDRVDRVKKTYIIDY